MVKLRRDSLFANLNSILLMPDMHIFEMATHFARNYSGFLSKSFNKTGFEDHLNDSIPSIRTYAI